MQMEATLGHHYNSCSSPWLTLANPNAKPDPNPKPDPNLDPDPTPTPNQAALGHHYNSDSPGCAEVVVAMGGLGFRLASAAEVDGFAPLEGAFGTPLVYQGSETTCASTHRQEVDLFFVRKANTPTALA